MKSLILLLACALGFANALKQELVDELAVKVQEYGIECSESEKATPADMEALMQKKPPVTHEGKCVIFCVSKHLNIMHDDGTFGEGYVEWLNKAKVDDPDFYKKLTAMYQECQEKVQPKEDHCETAFELASCSMAEARKSGIIEYLF